MTLRLPTREILIEGCLRLASQQWAALGVGVRTERPPNAVIDPEALLWFSLEIARQEPRFLDEIIAWVILNHPHICVARLRRIGPEKGDIRWRILSAIASKLQGKGSPLGWRRLAKSQEFRGQPLLERVPLFPGQADEAIEDHSELDPDFASRGVSRSRFESRGLSKCPRLSEPATILLRAKAVFGSEARAYVWATLLTRESTLNSFISEHTGYGQQAVGDALRSFVQSGICREERRTKAKWYCLADWQGWRSLFNLNDFIPPWPNWLKLFRGLICLARVLEKCEQQDLSEYLATSELRKAFVEVKDDLYASGISTPTRQPENYLVDQFLSVFREYISDLLRRSLFEK